MRANYSLPFLSNTYTANTIFTIMEDNVPPDCIRYSNFRQLFDNCHLSSYLINSDLRTLIWPNIDNTPTMELVILLLLQFKEWAAIATLVYIYSHTQRLLRNRGFTWQQSTLQEQRLHMQVIPAFTGSLQTTLNRKENLNFWGHRYLDWKMKIVLLAILAAAAMLSLAQGIILLVYHNQKRDFVGLMHDLSTHFSVICLVHSN